MAGAGVTLSLAFWAVDMCVFCLMLPVTFLPGAVLACLYCSVCLLQSPLTLSLTQAGLGLSCHSGKETDKSGGFSVMPLLHPASEPSM